MAYMAYRAAIGQFRLQRRTGPGRNGETSVAPGSTTTTRPPPGL